MATPSFNRRFGRTEFPAGEASESTLVGLDPAQDILLDVLEAAINNDLSGPWDAATTGTPIEGTSPVQRKHPHEPEQRYLREVKTDFPALFVHRDGVAEVAEFSLAKRKLTQKWQIHWVLGPLDSANCRKLTGAFPFVGKLISEVIEQGGHPAYEIDPSGQRALNVITSDSYCGFASARVTNIQAGQAGFADEGQPPTYWSLNVELETVELTGFASSTYGTRPLTAEWSLGTGNEDGLIEDLFLAESATDDD